MLYKQIASNKRKTWILLIVFFLLLALVGYAVGFLFMNSGIWGVTVAMIIGFIYALTMIFQSTEIVMSMNGAREVDRNEEPVLYHVVENPQNAAVAATSGLLEIMNREELEAVIGHEVSHIRNLDIRISTIAVALASAITLLSSMAGRMMWWGGDSRSRRSNDRDGGGLEIILLVLSLLAIVLAPLAATLVQLAISRQREFLADASSVELTRNPQGMINALQKLDNSQPMSHHVDDASSALYINDPQKPGFLKKLFYTHPPISERIERLKQM